MVVVATGSRACKVLLLVLLTSESSWAEGGAVQAQCGVPAHAGLPDEHGLKNFAYKHCPEECPIATKSLSDVCFAVCVSDCSNDFVLPFRPHVANSSGKATCVQCGCDDNGENCKPCKKCTTDGTRCTPDGCPEGFKFSESEGDCTLPAENLVKGFIIVVFISLIVLVVFLLVCFGGFRHLVEKIVYKSVSGVGKVAKNLSEGHDPIEPLLQSDEDPQVRAAVANWEVIKHAISITAKSSIRKSRARKHLRRKNAGIGKLHHIAETTPNRDVGILYKVVRILCRYMLFSTQSNSGIGMLLFRNTQKFYCYFALIIFVATVYGLDYNKVSTVAHYCDPDRVESSRAGLHSDHLLHAAIHRYHNLCCSGNSVPEVVAYATSIVYWGFAMWAILMVGTILFLSFQCMVLRKDEQSQQASGVDEQDYTLMLTNVPLHLTSEKLFKEQLEEKLNMRGKIYGVSIVYDIKEPHWESRIKEMCENLMLHDIVSCKHYPQRVKDMYLRTTTLAAVLEKVEKDKKEFRDWLTCQGDWADKRTNEPRVSEDSKKRRIGSGEAYVVFNRKVDLKMALPTVAGIKWDLDPDNPYRIMKVNECQWEPSDVLWYDCVPNDKEKLCKFVSASITMVCMLFVLFMLTGAVFYSSIVPYNAIGYDPSKSSTNFLIMNNLLVFVCMLIPGMPAGLAQGIGYTRMNDMESFIFKFIYAVFLIWNLTTIVVQWGTVGMGTYDLLGDVNQQNVSSILKEMDWAGVIPKVMFPGQMVQGYVINEILTALLPIIIPTAVCLCVFVLGIFPDFVRKLVAGLMLQLDDFKTIDARKFENAVQLQPYRLSMEYAFMMWVPLLSLHSLLFVTDQQLYLFGGLVAYSILMFMFVSVCLETMRDTSFDSATNFYAWAKAWGGLISFFPVLSIWWAIRLGWFSIKIGLIVGVGNYMISKLVYQELLFRIGFEGIMQQNLASEASSLEESRWETMEKRDKGFRVVLNGSGYSWWNMNPVYVLKHRYCPDLPGHEIDTEIGWPEGYLTKSLVEIGRDWRFKLGEDVDMESEKTRTSVFGNRSLVGPPPVATSSCRSCTKRAVQQAQPQPQPHPQPNQDHWFRHRDLLEELKHTETEIDHCTVM